MNLIVTPVCPLCSQPPKYVLAEGAQMFCSTDNCKAITWDGTATMDENMADISFMDLSGWLG